MYADWFRHVYSTAVVPSEVISSLDEPWSLIAEWWRYVPVAVLLRLDSGFLVYYSKRDDDEMLLGEYQGAKRVGLLEPVLVERGLWRRTADYAFGEFRRTFSSRYNDPTREISTAMFFDENEFPIRLEAIS